MSTNHTLEPVTGTDPLLAFHGDPAIKAKYLDRVEAHRRADEIVQGYGYWKDGKGCAVGCTLHGSHYADYEMELGIPEPLARLEDAIFEGLPADLARGWPTRFLSAPAVGADLSMVFPKFQLWLLTSDEIGLPGIADDRGRKCLATVATLYQRWVDGEKPLKVEWAAARAAAWSAASPAAWSAASPAAWSAASPAAWSAAWAASAAAWAASAASAAAWAASAASADARAAAWSAAWGTIADKLARLMA